MATEPMILQIMPAGGWRAAFVRMDFEFGRPEVVGEELVGWALLQERGEEPSVEGLVRLPGAEQQIVPCYQVWSGTVEDEVPERFLGYLKPGEDLSRYQEDAARLYASWRKDEEPTRALLDAGWALHESFDRAPFWTSPDGREMNREDALAELRGEGGGKG